MSPRSFWLALTLVAGCHSTDGGQSAAPNTSGVAATSTSTSAVASPPTTSQPPATQPANTTPGVLKLASGATLDVPSGATPSAMNNAAERLPGVVRAAHKYELGSEKRLLLVNEMDPEGLDCKAVIDRELDRVNKAKADTNETRRAMREVKGVTELKIGEHRALYAVSGNRVPEPGGSAADTSKPMLGVATLIMCRDKDYVVMMHAADQSVLPEDTKKMLVAIAASYKPAS